MDDKLKERFLIALLKDVSARLDLLAFLNKGESDEETKDILAKAKESDLALLALINEVLKK